MERPLHALQNKFLQDLRESKTLVAVFLVNGIRLQGQVEFFDNYIVAVKSTATQLVYKHAISTIVPIAIVPIDGEVMQPDQEKRNAAKPNVVVRTKPSRRLA
jgi:host factor-I protein